MTRLVGIDPGKTGGVALLEDGLPVWSYPLPYLNKQVDVHALTALVQLGEPARVIVEQQSIRGGQSGAMTIGANYGRILAVLELLDQAHSIVTPATWNKRAKVPPKLTGKAKKQQSFLIASRLWGRGFSDLGLTPSQDGRVEALLIGRFG